MGGGKTMKKLTKMGLQKVSKWVQKVATESTDSMSLFFYYEPKMPEELMGYNSKASSRKKY